LKALSAHAQAYPGTRSGKAAEEIVQILKKAPDAGNDAARREIKRVVEDAVYPGESA
jgi:esterase/lipase superfamily enzyme